MPVVKVIPEFAVIDDEVDIIVSDLHPNSAVTIDACTVYFKAIYIGYGHFFSDAGGTVRLNKHASYGGTYCGLQPMGLFNSMRPMPSNRASPRLLVKTSVEIPLSYKITASRGHLTRDEVHQLHIKFAVLGTTYPMADFYSERFLCQCDLKRSYLSPSVDRVPIKVKTDNEVICGVLFIPKGNKGPFPGVIDMFGGAGGCIETRAALLAKHGFAALALAYFGYDGLKATSILNFEMSYFDKAIDWLSKHPSVKPGGVSMVGLCLGAHVALLSAVRNPNVRSTVCVNGSALMTADPKTSNPFQDFFFSSSNVQQDHLYGNLYEIRNGRVSVNLDNLSVARHSRPVLNYNWDNPILFLLGEHDDMWKPWINDVIDQLKRSGKKNVFKAVIMGQGHLLEPPYMPLCMLATSPGNFVPNSEYDDIADTLTWNWNGSYKDHGPSQLKAWKVLLRFLRTSSLENETSKL